MSLKHVVVIVTILYYTWSCEKVWKCEAEVRIALRQVKVALQGDKRVDIPKLQFDEALPKCWQVRYLMASLPQGCLLNIIVPFLGISNSSFSTKSDRLHHQWLENRLPSRIGFESTQYGCKPPCRCFGSHPTSATYEAGQSIHYPSAERRSSIKAWWLRRSDFNRRV